METVKDIDENYCSDDDIFLSPDKKISRKLLNEQTNTMPIKGIYEDQVKRMKLCLAGIPRPPAESVDVCFTMEDIMLFINSENNKSQGDENHKNKDKNFGIYLNVDFSCEELERLGALYVEKYLPFETLSTMSYHTSYLNLTASAKKRRRCNGWTSSPGSRLSYLAKRKSAFSVDQVSKLGQPTNSKQILLQRFQNRKGIKSVPLKPKRALFQSPDDDKKRTNPFRTPDADQRRKAIRRLTLASPRSDRQQIQSISMKTRLQRSCRKSLEFAGDLGTKTIQPNNKASINKSDNNDESSDKHIKRKLLWAVSTALKDVSVTSSHPKFKICMKNLFKASLCAWTKRFQSNKTTIREEFSTSEAMLLLAKSLLESVVLPDLVNNVEGISTSSQENILKEAPDLSISDSLNVTPTNGGVSCFKDDFNISQYLVAVNKQVADERDEDSGIGVTPLTAVTHSGDCLLKKDDLDNLNVLLSSNINSLHTPKRSRRSIPSSLKCNDENKFSSSNHKRKRDMIEEEGISQTDSAFICQPVSKLRKTT